VLNIVQYVRTTKEMNIWRSKDQTVMGNMHDDLVEKPEMS
jgi:hypothetical protein